MLTLNVDAILDDDFLQESMGGRSPFVSPTGAPLLLGNHADRAVLTHLQDKLLTTANQDLTAALQRLHVGLSPSEEQQPLADLASGAAAGGAEAGSAGAGPSNGPRAPWLQGQGHYPTAVLQ
ncbi:hypothetical protein HaLaN_08512 [Haematococcus lacustris]|uniref:Uncharacterized protein n=1 Tax=Haematococcus lacustris TaxID=44745 RepID=A0A699Z174_HAELA|nr:hypothetical protein HaLaN_08512 [Haematococcus lacustris]